MTFIGRQATDEQPANQPLYVIGHESYRIPRNNAKNRAINGF